MSLRCWSRRWPSSVNLRHTFTCVALTMRPYRTTTSRPSTTPIFSTPQPTLKEEDWTSLAESSRLLVLAPTQSLGVLAPVLLLVTTMLSTSTRILTRWSYHYTTLQIVILVT